jgi:hypothetical protein
MGLSLNVIYFVCMISMIEKEIHANMQRCKYDLQWADFSRHSELPNIVVDISHTEFYPPRTPNVENVGNISFTSVSKAWPSVQRFSRNSRTINGIKWRPCASSCNQIGQKVRKVGQKLTYAPVRSSPAHCTFHKERLCRISWKFDNRSCRWQWVTEGQMDGMDMSIT